MGLFDELFGNDEEEKKKKEELEKEMDILGLEDWEKEEVRSGDYDVDSFDEENPEEGDYFFEDMK